MGFRACATMILAMLVSLVLLMPANARFVVKDEAYFLEDGVMTPEEMAEEGDFVKDMCGGNAYQALYFDCSCLGTAFTAKRQELGPDVYQNTILDDLTKGNDAVCANTAVIREHKYEECAKDVSGGWLSGAVADYNPTEEDQLGYCRCIADRFVEQFSAAPRLSSNYIQKIAVDTNLSCLKPEDR